MVGCLHSECGPDRAFHGTTKSVGSWFTNEEIEEQLEVELGQQLTAAKYRAWTPAPMRGKGVQRVRQSFYRSERQYL